jgi:hypothetical protein
VLLSSFLRAATTDCLAREKLAPAMTSGIMNSPTQGAPHSPTTPPFNPPLEPPPADARWIEFPRTDGDRGKWPVSTGERDTGGNINFFRPVHIDEKSAVDWRKKVGKHLAELRNYSGMHRPDDSRYTQNHLD